MSELFTPVTVIALGQALTMLMRATDCDWNRNRTWRRRWPC